jgi:Amt family ammonium transporter
MVAFMDTTATIPTGSMAERWKFKSFVLWGLFCGAIYYPIFGAWTWGGGWISQLGNSMEWGNGYADFAGSGVVHAVGGVAALAGSIVLGPRIGKFDKDGKPRALPGHHIPMAMLGTFILLFGWFGFNAASTFASSDPQIGLVAANTAIAGAFGGFVAMLWIWLRTGKPDPGMMANGLLAGLVIITAPCAFVDPWIAMVLGIVAGVVVIESVFFIERKLKIDDPVGAISVHGVCGAWGTLAIGLFATKDDAFLGRTDAGLFYGGGFDQLVTQAIMVVAVFAWVTITAGALFMAIKYTLGLRVTPEEELEGLDVLEHGSPGYAPDSLAGFDVDDLIAEMPKSKIPVG